MQDTNPDFSLQKELALFETLFPECEVSNTKLGPFPIQQCNAPIILTYTVASKPDIHKC